MPPIGAKVPQVPGRSTAITQTKSYERNFPPLEPTRHTLTGASQPSTYGSSGCRSSAHVKLDALSAADGLAMSTTPSRTAGQGPQVGFDPSERTAMAHADASSRPCSSLLALSHEAEGLWR